ncbi:hypothetical protein X975_19506, partial [Stegodyphus mimosarum]
MSLEDKESEILKIIETLTTTGQRTLDDDGMKKLKKICKLSNDYVSYAYYALMTQLRKKHSEIRYSALLIMNELFCRSSAFRKLLEVDLEEFLQLVAETDPEIPLPLPKSAAKALKLKGLEFMQKWCSEFGEKYTRLQLALTYLKKCKKVDFNNMEAQNAAQREHQRQEQERLERLQNEKVNVVKAEMKDLTDEISNLVIQIENCFRLLIPHPAEFSSPLDFENNKVDEQTANSVNNDTVDNNESKADTSGSKKDIASDFPENSLRQHGIYDMKQFIIVEVNNESKVAVSVNDDNLPVVENLNDMQKQITARYLPVVTKWLKILTKGSNCTDALKQAIDLKQLLESALEKYRELQLKPSTSNLGDDEDDDDFEEVEEKEGYEAVVREEYKASHPSQPEPGCSKSLSTVEKTYMWKLKHSEDDVNDPTSAVSTLNRLKEKYKTDLKNFDSSAKSIAESKAHKGELLEKVPVLPYDIDLYHWEDEKPVVPEVVKFDSLHKFWETKDDDNEENEALKEVQIASLRTRKIDFSGKFEPVKWSCRAPLPSGKLCPRKDRYKCPFHGNIIKRDSQGNPVDKVESTSTPGSQSSTSAVPDWQDPELLRDIESATGLNLKIPCKKSKTVKQVKGKQGKKKCGLTNINVPQTSARERLTKKILKRYKHYAPKLDEMERQKFNDKFGDQWNYY